MNLAIASIIAVMRERGFSEGDILAVVEAAVGQEKRSPGAIRQARYRERLKERDVTNNVTRDVTGSPDKERSPTPPKEINPSLLSSLRSDRAGVTPTPKKGVSSRRSQLAEDAEPSERDRELGAKAAMTDATIDLEWQRFRAHHIAKGSLMANWGQAWVTWVTNWKGFGAKQAAGQTATVTALPNGRGRGEYRPGIGMVYPDGTVYSMLHGRN